MSTFDFDLSCIGEIFVRTTEPAGDPEPLRAPSVEYDPDWAYKQLPAEIRRRVEAEEERKRLFLFRQLYSRYQ